MSNKINYLNLYSLFKINLLKKVVIVLCNQLKDKKVSDKNLLKIINSEEINLSTGINVIPYKSYIFMHRNKIKIFIWLLWYLDKQKRFSTVKRHYNFKFIKSYITKKKNKCSFTKNYKTAAFLSSLKFSSKTKRCIENIYKTEDFIKNKPILSGSFYEKYRFNKKVYTKPLSSSDLLFKHRIKKKNWKFSHNN
jgi:hypothetical protein